MFNPNCPSNSPTILLTTRPDQHLPKIKGTTITSSELYHFITSHSCQLFSPCKSFIFHTLSYHFSKELTTFNIKPQLTIDNHIPYFICSFKVIDIYIFKPIQLMQQKDTLNLQLNSKNSPCYL